MISRRAPGRGKVERTRFRMADEMRGSQVADNFARRFAPPELYDPKKRREWKLGRHDGERGPYVIELNLQHIEGLPGAVAALERLLNELDGDAGPPPRPEYISKTYARVMLTVAEWQRLLADDAKQSENLAHETAADPNLGRESGKPVDSMRYRA